MRKQHTSSKHSLDQFVDLVLSVAPNALFLVRMSLLSEALLGGVELEWPKEVVGYLEVRSMSSDLVNKIFDTRDSVLLSECLLNDGVISKRDSGSVHLAVTSLVDELSNSLLRRITIGNIWLNSSEHVNGGLVQSHEHSVVQLSQSKKLHDLFALGVKLVDTIKKILSFIIL